jgi:hypothetical protein
MVLAAISLVGGVAVWVLAGRRPRASLAVLVATFAAAFLWIWPTFMGPMDRMTLVADFAQQVRREVPPQAPLFSFTSAGNSIIYYAEHPMSYLSEPQQVRAEMDRGRQFYLVCPDKQLPVLDSLPGLKRLFNEEDPWHPGEGYWLLEYPGQDAP